jgi:arylsulfatase A-like enzyme
MQKTRRDFLKKAGVGVMGLSGLMPVAEAMSGREQTTKPNIILVLTDDQGWTDTSVQMMPGRSDSKSHFYQTPALERMAREGMVFSNAYSPAPVCTPTRVSIQFGKTPARLRDTGHYSSARKDFDDEVSIAEAIKAANPGYAAAHFGKWGGQKTSPEQAGYDRGDGKTNNYHGDWRSLKDRRPVPLDNPKQIFGLTHRACRFMEDQVKAGRTFYLQVSHYAVHSQHRALNKTIEKYRNLPRGKKCTPEDYESPPPGVNRWMLEYAAMIENLDAGLEGMLNKIDELGIAEKTYVIFFSDNGGDFRGNAPLRGQKSELWEGGIRVPMVVRGPGIKPGSRCDEPVVGWDFLPTFVDLAGGGKQNLPKNHDGGSLRPLFENSGKGRVGRPVEGLVFHFPDFQGVSMSAIRLGNYKLLKDWETGRIHLYNLSDDLSETRDLAVKMPGKADEMYRKLMDYLDSVNAEKAEDIHLDSLKQAIEQKRRLEIEIRELLDTEDQEGKERWSQLNMRLNFQHNRIEKLQERLRLINQASQREAKQ